MPFGTRFFEGTVVVHSKKTKMKLDIQALNYHLWEPCNMSCKFCFATFQDVKKTILPKGHLNKADSSKIIEEIIGAGFNKITFAGGEPTLCPWLDLLIEKAHSAGMTTMIVTNGSRINNNWLDKVKSSLDWIALSIDSIKPETLLNIGRVERKGPITSNSYLNLMEEISTRKIRLKLNTVVNSVNWTEDLTDFIKKTRPERWKIMQVLPIQGQNDKHIEDFLISDSQFNEFIKRHSSLEELGIKIVIENNEKMRGSYVMIDPAGRFFDNVDEHYTYSDPILSIGIEKALEQIRTDKTKFIARGGLYAWKGNEKNGLQNV